MFIFPALWYFYFLFVRVLFGVSLTWWWWLIIEERRVTDRMRSKCSQINNPGAIRIKKWWIIIIYKINNKKYNDNQCERIFVRQFEKRYILNVYHCVSDSCQYENNADNNKRKRATYWMQANVSSVPHDFLFPSLLNMCVQCSSAIRYMAATVIMPDQWKTKNGTEARWKELFDFFRSFLANASCFSVLRPIRALRLPSWIWISVLCMRTPGHINRNEQRYRMHACIAFVTLTYMAYRDARIWNATLRHQFSSVCFVHLFVRWN